MQVRGVSTKPELIKFQAFHLQQASTACFKVKVRIRFARVRDRVTRLPTKLWSVAVARFEVYIIYK